MKNFFSALSLLLLIACGKPSKQAQEIDRQVAEHPTALRHGQAQKPEGPLPILSVDNAEFDFGTVQETDKVEHVFTIKNTGEADLIIQTTQASCGCTTPDWTREPIAPGKEGFVKVAFNPSGRKGLNEKTITVLANTWPTETLLRFKVMVK